MANEAIDGKDSDFEMRAINPEVTALGGFHRVNLWLGSTIFISAQAIYGTTKNAVKIQIWIVVSVYVLIAIVKKRLNTEVD